ncbi:MAG: caspase family protein, partial [Bullifex sp.]|nr:caspase family protein [Bullifex sp.]
MKKILMLILSILMLTGCELITPEDTSPRNIYLVSVALDYKSMTRINPLNCTLNDQKAICDEFQYIADECDYPLTSVVITQNGRNYSVRLNDDAKKTETFSEATMIKEDVLSWLHELAAGLDRNDLLVFHYSGHGVDVTGELVLNKKDYSKDNSRNNLVMVTSEDLYEAVKDTDGIKFFVLDSCYSGVYADALTPVNPSSPFRDFFTLDSPNENIFVLTGASSDEKSWESGVYGNMTLCLL